MAQQAKRFKPTCVWDVYHGAYESKFSWEELLTPRMFEFYQAFEQAFNCPISVSLPTTLTSIAAICGPKTHMQIRKRNFVVPLNTYTFIIATPGGGKSTAYSKIVEPLITQIEDEAGYCMGVETYTVAGLQRMHQESHGRAMLVSDEGHRVLAGINAKQNRSEGERALLNKMWGGKGDTSCLLEKQRGFKETSFSMLLYIQPSPLLSELSVMGTDDGFMDRIMFFAVKPNLHLTNEMTRATTLLDDSYGVNYLPEVLMKIFRAHNKNNQANPETMYTFSRPGQSYYDMLSDEHAADFNRRYVSSGKEI